MGKITTKCRVDGEFRKIINDIKIEYLKRGKRVPSSVYITRKIAEKIRCGGVLNYDEFFKV